MFSAKSIEIIKQLEETEFENAVNNFGATYSSKHEAYAVLLEEIEEAEDELKNIKESINDIWTMVKKEDYEGLDSITQKIVFIALSSEYLALESSQIHAVCDKFLATIKGGQNE